MKDTIKRAFSRPVQVVGYIAMALATNHLMPKDPDALQWVAYGFIYASLLAVGLDNYTEGMDKGIKIMEKLS